MARLLSNSINTNYLALSLRSGNSKTTSVKTMACLQSSVYKLRGFSGLQSSNRLNTMISPVQGIQSGVATSITPKQRRGTTFVARAMFERFTEKAIKVIMLAQEEARRLGHNYVGTEQILLGLIGEGTGIAAKVLKSMGINLKDARVEVEKIIGRGNGFVAVEIPFTPRAKRVLELSLEEARQLGHNYIGSEHLLLGLLREGEGVAARLLENLGADASNIRTQVIRMVGESNEVTANIGPNTRDTKMPTLEEYGTNLTKLAEEGKLDPVVGRQPQIERVVQILGRRTKNNPCLIGEPGVGKTAIAEGLAQRIASGDVPETIEGKKVITLDMGLLVAGTKYRGEFEERLKKLMEEIKQSDEIILFIDEVHTLIGAGAAEGAIDAANILKPALARGELRRPYTVVLFDEIEKAHPDVFNMMLQILEDGRLTDSKGRTVDFKNTLLIMTSNVGSNVIEKGGKRIGFDLEIKSLVSEELKQYFRPEFLNRLDEMIVFRQLTKLEVKEIADIMLREVFNRLKDKEIELQVTERFRERVVDEGYNPSYGARPLRRAIMRLLEDSMAEKMLAGEIKEGDSVIMDVDSDGKVIVLNGNRGTPDALPDMLSVA
ncbi:Chaperone protein ClpC, chloroplastic [Linum perenne]